MRTRDVKNFENNTLLIGLMLTLGDVTHCNNCCKKLQFVQILPGNLQPMRVKQIIHYFFSTLIQFSG